MGWIFGEGVASLGVVTVVPCWTVFRLRVEEDCQGRLRIFILSGFVVSITITVLTDLHCIIFCYIMLCYVVFFILYYIISYYVLISNSNPAYQLVSMLLFTSHLLLMVEHLSIRRSDCK